MTPHSLFRWGGFRSSAGNILPWKIDCDVLTDADIQCIANVIAAHTTFSAVYGVPSGGNRLGIALQQFKDNKTARVLIVDDVLTTGRSIEAEKKKVEVKIRTGVRIEGWVIFARTEPADWINAVFRLMGAK